MISIIIPVYNAEKYLKRCIESVIQQTDSDWELLLINDGSKDTSGEICDSYSKEDNRIYVYHKKNGGVSSARNYGLERVKGEWIMFLDADDAIDRNTVKECSSFYGKNDVIRFSLKYILTTDGYKTSDYIVSPLSKDNYLSKILARETILGVCGAVYKRELFEKYCIRFDPSLTSGEDWVVLACLIRYSKSVAFIEAPLYLYTKYNETSATHSFSYKASKSSLLAYYSIERMIRETYQKNSYEVSLAAGKNDLIYNFFAHVVLEPLDIARTEFDEYCSLVGRQRFPDIKLVSKIGVKRSFLPYLFSYKIIRRLLRLRLFNR